MPVNIVSHGKTNVVLIGMPGSGKSTLGRILAKRLGKEFLDTDALIERDQNMPLQSVVSRRGFPYMRFLEERILSELTLDNHVIATGGSAVYSKLAMHNLGGNGIRVYLKISLATLIKRVSNTHSRGLVKMPSYPLPRLYAERQSLYQQAADIEVANDRPMTAVGVDVLLKELSVYQND